MAIFLIGTLDTKGAELAFARDRMLGEGVTVRVVDVGVLGSPAFEADVSRERVFEAAGTTLDAIRKAGDRGQAIEAAVRGVTKLVVAAHARGEVDAVLGLGGSAGTSIATAAMRALPLGLPKLMVSTMASGQVRPYVGVRDVTMMHSVVDISGLNRISRPILANAAAALVGMVRRPALPRVDDRPLVTLSMFGVTTPCVEACRSFVERRGFETLVFHATGSGGMTMESFVRDGLVRGVLDVTTTELADELVGGVLSAGPDRLTAAAIRGVPQVISLGALDMVNFGPVDTVPERFRGRRFHQHNSSVTLMRTTPDECDRLGKEIAQKASASRGPTAVIVPLRGVSALDAEGQPFWWPEADRALFDSLRSWMAPNVELIELDLHVNDPSFAEAASRTLLQRIR